MAETRKVIITCAVTGAIHTPSMSPHLPVTAEEIADAAVGAAEAGAAIVHLHARDPVTGRPDQTPEAFAPFLQVIKQRTDCVINLTTGGAPYMTIEERVRPAATFKPEVASLNMGSMNFGLFPMLNRFKEFKHDWERQALENSRNLVFKNTFQDIEYILRTCAENGTRFEFECYDTSHLYNLAHFLDRGLVQPPLFVQTVFGILGGIGPHPEDVLHMKRTADRLFGTATAGRSWAPAATIADRRHGGRHGRQCPGRAGGQPVGRPGPAGREQRRPGQAGAPDPGGAGAGGRDPGRGAGDPVAQGRRPGGLLRRQHPICSSTQKLSSPPVAGRIARRVGKATIAICSLSSWHSGRPQGTGPDGEVRPLPVVLDSQADLASFGAQGMDSWDNRCPATL